MPSNRIHTRIPFILTLLPAVLFLLLPQALADITAIPDRRTEHLNRTLRHSSIRTALNQSAILPNDTSIFYPPFATSFGEEYLLTVPACQRICGSRYEIKDDCAGRIKEWMLPVLLLLVSVEPTAVITVGVWRALSLYLFAMADPAGMFRGLLGRMRWEKKFRLAGREIWEEVKQQRKERRRALERGHAEVIAATVEQEEVDLGSHTEHIDAQGQGVVILVDLKNGDSARAVVVPLDGEEEPTCMLDNTESEGEGQTRRLKWWLWSQKRSSPEDQEAQRAKTMSESYGIILSAMADLLVDPDAAKGALRHTLLTRSLDASSQRRIVSDEDQDEAIITVADSLRFVPTRGAAVAWIAVVVCIVELIFLIVGPLRQQISASPSGAKIASAATFAWLLPLVAISAHLGRKGRVCEKIP
ncbi:hypothetical protein QBC35DRAFT_451373 [Podospora australis]|uniref:Uncharacterized protein n=1 Tax=Podospora australis TaxID=1536484 RepID=A0AAN6WU58_9PEZI|nr:hypothetical protein QBC35DRAFT_451373 [Podospora australis]